ncbi:Flp pilus assembly protein TadB [Kocuria rhizophila]|uniref:Hypothetical membrane protein n=1 Tax=Kocuria rhizophila (strain ATCC 9341 / DSM 348 / NBRC 103217 / DC2201) TaxID=378753 RepID=B2GK70_KOCRD|nr:hypothetical protein [Kocuria rhizophila]ASE11494.1 hypothetical protein CEP81_07465 [Kocuria rhizophila]MDV5998095.1 hypothetical protein [Kocuria rhizophila]BAG28469.1 hypothetical membrane protein [Kocuria rhizophila DC2201]VEH76247.1 Uncharacterised protein [Kocuria rhizophila]
MVWLIVMALGGALYFWAAVELNAANKGVRLPMLVGRAQKTPGRTHVLRFLGVFLIVFSALMLFDSIGYWNVALIVLFMTPAMLCGVLHNRKVARDTRSSGQTA